MKPSVIVWDLETVPDLGGFAAANDLVGKSDVEVREAIGDKFPKHIYHSIVCIGALIDSFGPALIHRSNGSVSVKRYARRPRRLIARGTRPRSKVCAAKSSCCVESWASPAR
jgi:hypothetical protein